MPVSDLLAEANEARRLQSLRSYMFLLKRGEGLNRGEAVRRALNHALVNYSAAEVKQIAAEIYAE